MKKYFLLFALSAASVAVFAQKPMDGINGSDNWSIGINAGGVTPFKHHAFFPNLRPAFGIELNKQMTPVIGFGFEGMSYVNTTSSRNVLDNTNVSLLGKFNLSNLFAGYNGAPRPFEVEAVGGAGWMRTYWNGEQDKNDLTSKVGLNFNFNLGESKKWTFGLKPALVYLLEKPTGGLSFNANRAVVEITAGLVYHFKNSNGKRYMSFAEVDQSELDRLNAAINNLQSDLQNQTVLTNQANQALNAANSKANDLQKALNDCLEKAKTPGAAKAGLESIVTFRQGSATIDATQMPSVDRVATHMKNNSGSTVIIKGFASPEGNLEFNERLAKQRAESVKNMLVSRFGIAAGRITIEGRGIGDIFSEPEWNRVSIATVTEAK